MKRPELKQALGRLLGPAEPEIGCDECFERLDEYVESRARDQHHTDPAMDAHLRGCSACREEAEGLLELIAEDAGAGSAR